MGCCECCQTKSLDCHDVILDDTFDYTRSKFETKKILLLGTASSGKSALCTQMRNIYGDDNEFKQNNLLEENKKVIYQQILNEMKTILEFIQTMRKQESFMNSPNNCSFYMNIIHSNNQHVTTLFVNYFYKRKTHFPHSLVVMISAFIPTLVIYAKIQDSIEYIKSDLSECFDKMLIAHIKNIWNHKSVKNLFKIRNLYKLHLYNSSAYFWNEIDRISDNKYQPIIDDILRLGNHTKGIIEHKLIIGDVDCKIFQVCGLRDERKRWIHCFDSVTCVIFTASLSCYNEYLFEDKETNAMHEQIHLFEEICNLRWFRDSAMVLFLTKDDLFRDKIQNIPINVIWNTDIYDVNSYDNPNDYVQTLEFIKKIFGKQNKNENNRIFIYNVNLLNKNSTTQVFDEVSRIIINHSLSRGGLI
eukprot:120593_1